MKTSAKDQVTHKVDHQPMNNQKLDEISYAQTQENLKQLEEVDVHEKKNTQRRKGTCKLAILFSCESYTLSIQTTAQNK